MKAVVDILADLEVAVADVPPGDAPAVLCRLAAVQTAVAARLTAPRAAAAPGGGDRMLKVAELAQRMNQSADYIYRHAADWPFTRRHGRSLRFSEAGFERWASVRR